MDTGFCCLSAVFLLSAFLVCVLILSLSGATYGLSTQPVLSGDQVLELRTKLMWSSFYWVVAWTLGLLAASLLETLSPVTSCQGTAVVIFLKSHLIQVPLGRDDLNSNNPIEAVGTYPCSHPVGSQPGGPIEALVRPVSHTWKP